MSNTPDPNPLEFITTEQMFDELKRRNAVVLLFYENNSVKGKSDFGVFYDGGLTACIGAVERVKHMMLADAVKESTHVHDDVPEDDDE